MKNAIWISILVCVLSSSLVLADSKPNVVVSYFEASPGAFVGKDFDLRLTFVNVEPAYCAQTITTSVVAGFPFISTGPGTVPVGDLCTSDSKTIDVPMRVDPTATGGFYQVQIVSNYESTTGVQFSNTNTFNVFVNGTPQLSAHISGSNPVDVYPGDSATIDVAIDNTGSFQAQNVTASLTASSPVEVKWANSLNTIPSLDARAEKTVQFGFDIPKDAAANDFPAMLHITYTDENLEIHSEDVNLILHVKGKAKFETSKSGGDNFYASDSGDPLVFMIKNSGTDIAKNVKVKLEPAFPFSSDGSLRFIPQLNVGDSLPVSMNVDIDKDAKPGKYSVDVLLDFEDAQGNKFQDTVPAEVDVQQTNFVRGVFLNYLAVWIIAAAVLLLVILRRLRKKK